jgi:hypothetical protein
MLVLSDNEATDILLNENHVEIQRNDRLRGSDGVVYFVGDVDPGRAVVDGGATFPGFGGRLSGVFGRVPSDGGTVVLLLRTPDGRLFTLREYLCGVHYRSVALSFPARFARRQISASMDIDRRRHPDGGRFHGRNFRSVREYLSFAGADRDIIRSGRRFLRNARLRLGVKRLARRVGEAQSELLNSMPQPTSTL